MANTVNLEFAGDATKLAKAGKDAERATMGVGDAAARSSDQLAGASRTADTYTDRVGALGAGVEGMSGAFDSAGAAVQGLADMQQAGVERAQRLARAANDVRQAMEDQKQAVRDASQALIDGDQAALDMEQAQLDAAQAQRDYNDAVREHGKDSLEARQAQLDLKQAGVDVKQAQEDAAQAIRDGEQASIDAEAATLDLAEAQREANPPDLQQWADQVNMVTPILSGLIGVVGLVTAAQWAWNAAQLASPTTWIILAIVALIAIIVLIATKTTWFQDLWKKVWSGVKSAASAVGSWFKDTLWNKWIKGTWNNIVDKGKEALKWMAGMPDKLKEAFAKVKDFMFAPFRAAFNLISDAWNSTIGALSWKVPSWIPGIGGESISVPNLPHYHSGGVVPGAPGTEQLAVLQAGETVTSMAGSAGGGREEWIRVDLGELGDALLRPIARAVSRRGGSVTALGVRVTRAGVVV
jgi:hypothetical protein